MSCATFGFDGFSFAEVINSFRPRTSENDNMLTALT